MSDASADQRLTYDQLQDEGLADWRVLLGALRARFETGSFASGLELVDRIGAAAEEADHHPDVVLTYPRVDVVLRSHDVGGITVRDVDLAGAISGFAAELGITAAPERLAVLEVALDVPDPGEIHAFWAAVTGHGGEGAQDEVVDPTGQLPGLWFQNAPGATGDQQQRFHLDIWVARDAAEERIAQALAAGGRLVSDAEAPSFWVLADVHGNQACLCTADRAAAAPHNDPAADSAADPAAANATRT